MILLRTLSTKAAMKGYRVHYTLATKLVSELVEAAYEQCQTSLQHRPGRGAEGGWGRFSGRTVRACWSMSSVFSIRTSELDAPCSRASTPITASSISSDRTNSQTASDSSWRRIARP